MYLSVCHSVSAVYLPLDISGIAAAGPLHVLSAASSFLPQAALAAVTTAATVAASPAAVAGAAATSLAYFQGTRYQGNNSLSTNPNTYWLRKFGLDDSRVTAFLVAANVGCYGMQQLSSTFTAGCVRVRLWAADGISKVACFCTCK